MSRSRKLMATALWLVAVSAASPNGVDAQGTENQAKIHLFPPAPRVGALDPPLVAEVVSPGGTVARTWKAMRDAGVVRQAWDYSCGSAALATLLSSDTEPISEKAILVEALDGLSEEEQKLTMEQGLSLLDLARVVEARGLRSAGYRVGPDVLAGLKRPVLVYIEPDGYRHFAVLRGMRGDRVFVADPARGNVRMPIWEFLDMWLDESGRGVIFVVAADTPSTLILPQHALSRPELPGARHLIKSQATTVKRIQGP